MSAESTPRERSDAADSEELDVMGEGDAANRELDVMAGRPGAEPQGGDVMSEEDSEN